MAAGLDRHPVLMEFGALRDGVQKQGAQRHGTRRAGNLRPGAQWNQARLRSHRLRAVASMAVAGLVVVASGIAGAGCAGQDQTGSAASRVSAWVGPGGGGTSIGTLRADVANVDLAFAAHNKPGAIRTVCALLSTDANKAIGNLPAPDERLTTALNRAFEDAAAAGDECFRGAAGPASLLAASARHRAAFGPLLEVALHRIEAITGHAPSTPTTEPPPNGDPFGGGGA